MDAIERAALVAELKAEARETARQELLLAFGALVDEIKRDPWLMNACGDRLIGAIARAAIERAATLRISDLHRPAPMGGRAGVRAGAEADADASAHHEGTSS